MNKKIYFNILATVLVIIFSSCEDRLEEENHSVLTPEFFNTPDGFAYGLNAAYAGLRDFYGREEGIQGITVPGTDEFFTPGGSRPSNLANYNSNYTPSNEYSRETWNKAYTMINTCNGLVDFGSAMAGMPEADKKRMLAEAKFLRAFYYFKLVQFFGDATLNKNYQSTPTTSAIRHDKAEIYSFIIEDLTVAVRDLPAAPKPGGADAGRATAAAARHMLALVYLTRGWSDDAQANDFQNAFNTAKGLIDESASIGIGLLDDFAAVFTAGNENNKEVLFNVQYSPDLTYGGSHPLNHLFVTGYHQQLGDRTVPYGRPYVWYRGTNWLYTDAFTERDVDTRYKKTFQTVWLAIANKTATQAFTINGVSYSKNTSIVKGDTAIYMPGYNLAPEKMLAKSYFIFTPETYTSTSYPTMTKFLDPNRQTANENSHRPIIIYRLAETYLVAAEAALKLNNPDLAAEYLNIVRRRAAVDGKEAEIEITGADVNIDFILDERTRELCGENMRWLDLVRTHKLIERVKAYDRWEAYKNIKDFHVLRPVPQSQIDAVITGDRYPQNKDWF